MRPPEVCMAIQAPQRRVWAALTELDELEAVLSDVDTVEFLTEPAFKVGAQWRQCRRSVRGPTSEIVTVTAVHAPVAYSLRGECHGMQYTKTTELVALSPARTQVTSRLVVHPANSAGFARRGFVRAFGRVETNQLVKRTRSELGDIAERVRLHHC
ncbi:SRPBCC family protein [Haloechinothrix sp. LS1_15]|uniref:SRPBCC family protein n=1 Tax=Haloechinothrix sp. LS1_15 TaxID=2652248 RepID=UPI0029463743|nr:SRPBCC family protein [Haloechinothrix sp. LS1_15]MDV6010960.1 SRPBCC family protein [Haloechinothrix sp. LS1_15]